MVRPRFITCKGDAAAAAAAAPLLPLLELSPELELLLLPPLLDVSPLLWLSEVAPLLPLSDVSLLLGLSEGPRLLRLSAVLPLLPLSKLSLLLLVFALSLLLGTTSAPTAGGSLSLLHAPTVLLVLPCSGPNPLQSWGVGLRLGLPVWPACALAPALAAGCTQLLAVGPAAAVWCGCETVASAFTVRHTRTVTTASSAGS
jgi:hypothetical protein